MKIAFKTFGCKTNFVDTDSLYAAAKHHGLSLVGEAEFADAYVINSCTVTEGADREARQYARRYKRRNPAALVALVGCYAQVSKETLINLPEVDFVVGTAEKHKVLTLVHQAYSNIKNSEKPSLTPIGKDHVGKASGFLVEHFPGSRNARASIKVQDGCNFSCSFCIIPRARGRSRSLPLEVVERQVKDAFREGFNEVVLTGIHLAHYGWDQGTDLTSLVRRLLMNKNSPRIRLSTLDPFEVPDDLIFLLKEEEQLCPHFHIALQSGSDGILKAMKRTYKASEFSDTCRKIQAARPNAFIGVDVIVGFPGETEAEFNETVNVLENSPWTKLHVFPYSCRPGTMTESYADPLPPQVKKARSQILLELSHTHHQNFLKSQVGKTLSLIFERKLSNRWLGHTENYAEVLANAPSAVNKQLSPIKISHVNGSRLEGSLFPGDNQSFTLHFTSRW